MTTLAAFDLVVVASATSADVVASAVVADAFDAYVDVVVAAATLDFAPDVALAIDVPVIVGDGPPLPPRIMDRSSLAKLELRVEKYPPSKPFAPAARAGSWPFVGSSRLSIVLGR